MAYFFNRGIGSVQQAIEGIAFANTIKSREAMLVIYDYQTSLKCYLNSRSPHGLITLWLVRNLLSSKKLF